MKKLSGWARSRSRRRGSQGKGVEKRASTDNLASPNGKAISSKTAPPVPEIPRDYRVGRQLDDGNARPGSSNRMKPMLIGVSGPTGNLSRPGTSGSLQNAVTSAADKVAQFPSSDFRPGHTRTKSSRYIDIFSISNAKTAFSSYNEDIAERNLDTNIVSKEVLRDGYVPSSKYQEEVARRNAAPPLRTSMDQVRLSSSDGYRPNYAELRAHGAPKEYEVEGRLANDEDIRKFHEAEKAVQYEYRRRRQLLGEPVQSTPTTADVRDSNRPETRGRDYSRHQMWNGVVRKSVPVSHPQQPDVPIQERVVPYSRQSIEGQRQLEQESRPLSASQMIHTGVIPTGTLPGYQVSRSELSQPREADTLSMSQQSITDRPGMPERGSSSLSIASSVKRTINLPHRKIMDLTGDDSDVFSDGDGAESYMNRSPVVEQAVQDSCSKLRPSVVDSFVKAEQPRDPTLKDNSGDITPTPSTAVDDERQYSEPSMQYPPPSTFSAINPVASLSPKTKNYVEPISVLEAKPTPLAKETRKSTSGKLYTVAETEPELDDYETPVEEYRRGFPCSRQVIDSDTPESDNNFSAPVIERHDFAMGQRGLKKIPIVPPSPAASLKTPTQSDFGQSTPNRIQLSPESLHSSDFINPSNSFGVLTRDFAVTPTRNASSQPLAANRGDIEPNTSAKVKSPLKSKPVYILPNGEPLRPAEPEDRTIPKYSSDFNEDEFKRKQDQARAALIRLQQSLNEEFIPPPRETGKAQPKANSARRHTNSNSSNDGRPYATPPSSIFTQVRDYHRPATSQVNGYTESRETSRQRTAFSVHEQVTKPRYASPAPAATVKPIRRQISPNPESRDMRRHSKGKEKEPSSGLSEMQRLASEMKNTKLVMPNPSQQRIYQDAVAPSPGSPGEISLSSFPVPTPAHSRQTSTMSNSVAGPSHQHTGSNFSSFSRAAAAPSPVVSPTPGSPDQYRHVVSRRGSIKSQASAMTSTSQHSIPYHLIPERGSSMRDSLVKEEDEL